MRREAAIGQAFGSSSREVKRYVKRVRRTLAAGREIPPLTSTEDLVAQIARTDAAVVELVSTPGSRLARWRNKQRASSIAQDRLFAVGVLVADVARRTLFDLSYTLAVGMLAEDAAR